MNNIKKMFMCNCGLEGIAIEKDPDNNDIYLDCYIGCGFYTEQSLIRKFFKRFKIAWMILIKGDYRFYSMILSQDTANAISKELLS